MRAEADAYSERLERQLQFLREKAEKAVASYREEFELQEAMFQEHSANVDRQLMEFTTKPTPAKPAAFKAPVPEAAPVSTAQPGSAEHDANTVVRFWKTKYGQIAEATEAIRQEHECIRGRLQDLRTLQSDDQFRAVRVLGELRREEDTINQTANGYRLLLQRLLQDKSPKSPRSPRSPRGGRDDPDRAQSEAKQTRDRFSAIDRRVVEAEEEALKTLTAAVEARVRALKSVHQAYARRADHLQYRHNEIVSQTKAAPTASLDKTLQMAMDLRTKSTSPPPDRPDDDDAAAQHQEAERALRADIDKWLALAAQQEEQMSREIRERKVKVIRSIHASGGSVDARFEHVRAQQCMSAIAKQVSLAESERVTLKLQLASAAGQAQRNLELYDSLAAA